MSILFQYPALLGLLALAGVPALVHLLSRARPPVYRFSNLEFLRRVLRTTARFRRPKDWILLALRTLALAALAAAFAAPFLVSRSARPPGQTSTVILLIDRSASMAAREGAGTRLDAACNQAARFLDETAPEHANIVWIDAEPDAAFPAPGPNIPFLSERLKQSKPLPEAGALPAAFDLALRQFSRIQGHRELVVISDFQSSAWRDFAPKFPQDVVLRTHRVGTTAPANLAVTRLLPQPAEPVVGQEVTVLAEVKNYSPDPVATRLTLDADGALQTQPVSIAPWGEAQTAFLVKPATAGQLPVTVSLAAAAADTFPADDARHAVVRVRDSLRLVSDAPADGPDARLLRKLASALTWLEVPSGAGGAAADYCYISAWTGDAPDALEKAAREGAAQWVKPAPGCPVAAIRGLLGLPAQATDGALALDASPAGWTVIPADDHPAMRLFKAGDFGNPFAGVFRERLKLPSTLIQQGVRTIATYADGVPAILERSTGGAPILVWNLSFDPAKTDWPVQGPFLPGMAELFLRTRPHTAAEPAFGRSGFCVSWTSGDPAHAGAIELLDPDKQPVAIAETTRPEGSLWQAKTPAVPGLYRWRISGQTIAHTAVNFPETESDLRCLETTPAFGKLDASDDALVRQAALAKGIPLWPWLVLTALLALAAESVIHIRSRG